MEHKRELCKIALFLIIIFFFLSELNSTLRFYAPLPRPPIRIQLTVSPDKWLYSAEDTIRITYKIYLNPADSTYERGYTYMIDTDNNGFWQQGMEIIESTLDTLTYLSDDNNEISGIITARYIGFSPMQWSLQIYRLTNETSLRYIKKVQKYFDQEGIFYMIPRYRYDIKLDGDCNFYYLDY